MTDPATLAERLQAWARDNAIKYQTSALMAESAATLTAQAERIADLERALSGLADTIQEAPRGYVGDHYIHTVQFSEATIEHLRKFARKALGGAP